MQSRKIRLYNNNHQLNYYQIGAGPALILVIGSDATINVWNREFILPLSKYFSVYLLDYWGINSDESVSGNLSFSSMASDIANFIQQLRISKPRVLGWSMGGGVVQELAYGHAHLLDSIILLAPVTPNNKLAAGFKGEPYTSFTSYEAMLDFIFRVNIHGYSPDQRGEWQAKFINPHGSIIPRPEISQSQGQAITAWRNSVHSNKLFMQFRLPTLCIVPEYDVILDYDTTICDIQKFNNYELKIANECGHNVALQHPQMAIETILTFCQKSN